MVGRNSFLGTVKVALSVFDEGRKLVTRICMCVLTTHNCKSLPS